MSTENCTDFFELKPGVCGEDLALHSSTYTGTYENVTLEVCEHLCVNLYPTECSSILYSGVTITCTMLAYTATDARPNSQANCFGKSQLYRRRRCICKHWPACVPMQALWALT